MEPLQDRVSSTVNVPGTSGKIDTALTQDRSPSVPKPWEARAARAKAIVANIRRPKPVPEVDRSIPADSQQHVYLAYSAGRLKVGTSIDMKARSRGLNGQSPHPVTMILAIPGNSDLERRLHVCLDALRLHGEWFKITPQLREQFLDASLCRTGRRKLKRAEAEFKKWVLDEFLT